jgi:hypothetical protein
MKVITLTAIAMGAVILLSCHRMQDIGGTGPGPDADSDSDADTDSDYDSDFDAFGYMNLAQRTSDPADGGFLTLTAACYDEPYDSATDSWVESRTTPDGVECDIYYVSGLPPDDSDPPPDQVDCGAFRAGYLGGWPDVLVVAFDGEGYTSDHRTEWDVDNPLPSWLVPGSFEIPIGGSGNAAVDDFEEQVAISPIPEVSPDSPGLDEAGNYIWEWSSNGADEVVFSLHFNMDWDNSSFICPVDPGVEQIMIPEEWIGEYSWGGGELALFSRDQVEVAAGDGLVLLNVTRAHTVPFLSASD